VLGDRAKLKERPICSYVQTPISPLQNDGRTMELLLNWAEVQMPIVLELLPLSGGTAPVTLEGTVLQETANFLGNMAFYQLVSPGWPIIWGATAGTIDMRSGRWSGVTEGVLMSLALVEMAKTVYDVPVAVFGQSSQSHAIDFYSGMEAIFADAILSMAGADNLWGVADMDAATYVDLDYVVLSTEAVRMMKRVRRGLTFDADHMLMDVILEQGFEGRRGLEGAGQDRHRCRSRATDGDSRQTRADRASARGARRNPTGDGSGRGGVAPELGLGPAGGAPRGRSR